MRYVSIGNERTLINLDQLGRIIDIYYPHAGMENHTNGKPVRQYIFTQGKLIPDEEWRVSLNYFHNTNIAEIDASINSDIRLLAYDFSDIYAPLYYRILKVYNTSNSPLKIKLIFNFDLDLYSTPFGDTAFIEPETNSIVHYKSRRYIGIKLFSILKDMQEYSVGKEEIADEIRRGYLSNRPIENGDVQSALALELEINPSNSEKAYLALAFGRSLSEIKTLLRRANSTEIESSFVTNHSFWSNWLFKSERKFSLQKMNDLYKISLLTIRDHMNENGSIIASSDYSFMGIYGDAYTYCWPRDSAISAYALDIAGYGELALKHYKFISKLISEEGYLYHKYNPDSTLASSWHPWIYKGKRILPIQEDETALEVWAIANHYRIYKDIDELVEIYRSFIKPAIKFLMKFIEDGLPKPSFDLWEERYGIHIYTVSTVYGALTEASKLVYDMGDEVMASDMVSVAEYMKSMMLRKMTYNGRFIRRLDENGNIDTTIDASMYSPFFFGVIDPKDPIMVSTINAIESALKVNGGIIRYEGDTYRRSKSRPNPWLITTLWVAEYYLRVGNVQKANEYISWVLDRAVPTGLLPEQVDPDNLQSTSVLPLVWSHSELVIASHQMKEAI
ncbi:glycoside hydrolase family 15 protein [Sulfolobus acidocaldarius]|uniref:Glycosyl hydrolase n=4 Tax=Sulfolobus acidocaldarius TaxID=2285 RepID=Q4J9I5_SULAC|nr:glycoside hydrolase family 15 protein [Sulfolobus acidocaldarius]AAY80545.1 glycosyl hydrolase [Sulfolobus acidocaldarius DSM 639]AGE71134.1 glycosyl hydrolase [Sulfolobus acidocaldarius N8]AGE73404.1 glycosyl hydrolase [Sulfolobus acidocaldarius Ron12/I]ALU28594.1 glucan 1,3-alpha-glucosidase [Sulfolobus acidocaldarius]ALU31307.1 glucan 1,3-alpha-glucosidase [Sulfolobus acidocaldarius]